MLPAVLEKCSWTQILLLPSCAGNECTPCPTKSFCCRFDGPRQSEVISILIQFEEEEITSAYISHQDLGCQQSLCKARCCCLTEKLMSSLSFESHANKLQYLQQAWEITCPSSPSAWIWIWPVITIHCTCQGWWRKKELSWACCDFCYFVQWKGEKESSKMYFNSTSVPFSGEESSFHMAAPGFQFFSAVFLHAAGTAYCPESNSLFLPACITGRDRWKLEIAGLS